MSRVLPERPDLNQLRRQAKELQRAAAAAEPQAVARLRAVSDRATLAAAQLALAREHGFPSWARLKAEVERKRLIAAGDVDGFARLLAALPGLATEPVSSCYSGAHASALSYVGVARFHGVADHDLGGALARALLAAGAAAEGAPGAEETPLITAASYGETDMVRALIEAGADLEATGSALPGGTALSHAVEFGNVEAVDVLVVAGAAIRTLAEAAGAGRLDDRLSASPPLADRTHALRAAALNQRLEVIDELLASGVPVDAEVDAGGASALHWAAYHGKAAAVAHLLERGAGPLRRDREHDSTPLDWCRHRRGEVSAFGDHLIRGHLEVERLLQPLAGPR